MVDKDGDGQLDIEELKQVRPAPLASAAAKLPSRVSRSQLPRRRHQDGARGQPSPRHFHHLVDVLMCVVSRPHRLQARGRPSSRLATPEGLYGLATCAMVHAYSTREYMPVGVEARRTTPRSDDSTKMTDEKQKDGWSGRSRTGREERSPTLLLLRVLLSYTEFEIKHGLDFAVNPIELSAGV